MKFLYPSFLFALFAIAIPIIIHLFNFRKYKKLYFPNVKFLQSVQQQTQAKSKPKHLLVLAARILSIIALVFAFAQPYLPVDNKKIDSSEKAISIYIDNSFSMEAINDNGLLLNEAKKKALEIIAAYKPSDLFQLLTNDFEGRHQRFVNKEEFEELLDEVKVSPSVKSLSEIISRQQDLLSTAQEKSKISFVISDFQKSFANIKSIKNDTAIKTNLVPVIGNKNNNLFIDSIWFSNPVRQVNQPEVLVARIRNSSENNFENIPIKLYINNQQKAPASFSIEANSTIDFTLNYVSKEKGIHHGIIKLNDYPISYDDDFFFSYSVAPNIKILAINQDKESNYLNSLFLNDSLFIFNNVNEKNIDYSALSNNQLIIINDLINVSSGLAQELKKFIDNGGSLAIFPNYAAELKSYKDFLSSLNMDYYTSIDTSNQKVVKINLDHSLFKNVFTKIPENLDLPVTQAHFTVSKNNRTTRENLLSLQNNEAFLNQYTYGKGKVYLYTVPLVQDFSNLPKHALFVPLMYNTGSLSQTQLPPYYTIGDKKLIEINKNNLSGDKVYHLVNFKDKFDIIPHHQIIDNKSKIDVHDQISAAGNYSLTDGQDTIEPISFNFNRKESELSYYSTDELTDESAGFKNFTLLKSSEKSLTQTINEINLGIRFWKLCIILALLFLGAEVLLLRFWK